MTKDGHGIVYRREQRCKLLYITLRANQDQDERFFYLNKDKEKHKKTETDLSHSKSSRSRYHLHCYHHGRKNCMCQLETRPVFGRFSFKYYRSLPVKRGQKVQVLWGTKTKKELTAVVSVYPVVEKEDATTDVLPSRRTKAKRKLVSTL